MGKHVRLPFVSSKSISTRPFEIIHIDLWTSHVSSISDYKFYVLFLDHYTNFLWTFPLFHKSQVYDIFVNFHAFVHTQFRLPIQSFQCDLGVNLIISYFITFALLGVLGVLLFVFLVLKHHLKMTSLKEKFVQLIILSALYYVMLLFLLNFGLDILPSKLLDNLTPTHLLYHKSPTYKHL